MDSSRILYPQPLHFSCRMCAGCCRGWNVLVGEPELERFRHHNWAETRDRFAGREITTQLSDGRTRLTRVDDACIFLDEDNLCAIHRELGESAKPNMCRQFPLHPVSTPAGVVASLDFACPTVVVDEGAAIETHEAEFRRIVEVSRTEAPTAEEPSMAGPTRSVRGGGIRARVSVPLGWPEYQALESAMLATLANDRLRFTERMLIVDWMAMEAHQHAEPGEMTGWVEELLANPDLLTLAATPPQSSAMRQRALLAPLIAGIEGGRIVQSGGASPPWQRMRVALAIVRARGKPWLATAEAGLDLSRMLRIRFAQDAPELAEMLGRFMAAFLVRKSLIDRTSAAQGSRHLALLFGAVRWYAVARAAMADRDAVTPDDLRYAIVLAERYISHAANFPSPELTTALNLLFDHVAPARVLYQSPYPG
jgi:Fe-S-cluster containining protein